MRNLYLIAFFLVVFPFQATFAQQPQKPNAVDVYNQIQKLNFLGSVLYIAAHPDDENTRLISYMANEKHARTGYLSLTRGDGGQNLVGPELRELLGVIRTQELLEARRIDGGEQFFTRANDFGYSKIPDETLRIWNKAEVLADMIYIIRKFQPDVIINRFDSRSPGTTHGHHTSSAMLSLEAFDMTGDAKVLPNQLNLVRTWQPRRLFFNTSWWFYGGKDKFEKADKSKLFNVPTGVYYPALGKSNQEIAALSRSRHQSQGFGSTGTRGEDLEYMEFIKGDAPSDKTNIFEGIDTSWSRVKNGKAIGELLSDILKRYDFKNPAASVSDLLKVYAMIQALDDNHWKPVKSDEVRKIIAACTGLYLEAVSGSQDATPGSTIALKIEAISRSNIQMQLSALETFPESNNKFAPVALKNNISQNFEWEMPLPATLDYTQPYWLKEKGTIGMYRVDDQKKIGIPDIIREVKVRFTVDINGIKIPYERHVVFKYNDDAKGEVYTPFDVIPDVTVAFPEKVTIFNDDRPKPVAIKIRAGKDNSDGELKLELPSNWTATPRTIPFTLHKKGEEQTFHFSVKPPVSADEISVKGIAIVDGMRFEKELIPINYEHISKQQVLNPAESQFIKLDIRTGAEKIAYIMGAGDEVPKSLKQMGYDVWELKPEEITPEKLQEFNVVMTGIRAYNTVSALALKQNILFDFVRGGKTMIVQYNTLDDFVTKEIAPYPFKISRDRVTEEDAEVRFLEPDHQLLNYPNKITSKDFEGWKQEQGLYYPNEWDSAFTPILSANDKGESPKKGALLVAKYGKGNYIYTGLSFFRELPEGVSGAFRLMANLISIGTSKI